MTGQAWPSITWALRYYDGWFYLYLMWFDHRPPHPWRWARQFHGKRYRTLERAIATLDRRAGQGEHVIMIFPAQE